jgi:hypothetical protein
VDYTWLSRWKFQFRISLRQPNRKWSVPRAIMKERLEITWCNIFRVRQLMARSLGYDPIIENFDQSPFHMNEVGSKATGSLSITGGGSVALVEGHAATRERWSANTMVASRSAVAGRFPPLQLMFKAKSGARVLPKLQEAVPCWAKWLSVEVSQSGSYCESDILNYLELVLEPMSPDRDWRILLVDAYAAQTTKACRRACWHRGYVLISHGGGTTGVSQVNDTDLHQALKRNYMELESQDMLDQQRLRPHAVPVPRKEDCILWMAAVWHNPVLHTAAADGFLKTGQANALDGSQDYRICREARLFWDESQMWRRRAEVTHDVDVEYDSHRLSWSYNDVDRLVVAFPMHGQRYDNLHSDEGSDEPDEDASDGDSDDGDDDGEPAVAACDDGEPAVAGCKPAVPDHAGAAAAAVPSHAGAAAAAGPLALVSMDAAEADLAHDHQLSLDVLRVVLEQVRAVGQDALAATVSHAIVVQERRCRGTKRASDAVAQAMVGNHASAVADVAAAQTIVAKADAEAKRTRHTLRQMQEESDRLDKARFALQKATTVVECLDAVKKFETSDLGQGHVTGGTKENFKHRMQVLERLRRRFPPLPAEQQNDWEWFTPRWDRARLARLHHLNKNAWGSQFKNEVLVILQSLRDGDELALSRWMAVQSREFLCIPALRV